MPFCKSDNLTLFMWGQNLFSSINPVFTGIFTEEFTFLLCWVSNVAWMGLAKGSWEFYRIWSYLNQLFQSCNIWWGREKGILLHFFSGFFSLPTLPWPTNQSDWVKMLEFYAKSSEVCYMAPKSLLNQTESSGCWKAYLESDLTMNFGMTSLQHIPGESNLFWCFVAVQ